MEIESVVKTFIVDELLHAGSGAPLGPDDSLISTGLLDSLALLKLVLFLETRFEVKVHDRDVVPGNFETLNRIVSFVERHRPRPEAVVPTQGHG